MAEISLPGELRDRYTANPELAVSSFTPQLSAIECYALKLNHPGAVCVLMQAKKSVMAAGTELTEEDIDRSIEEGTAPLATYIAVFTLGL
uniref:Uncharacterized protein n=1 Tax=Mycena chlorophos TaxID=658473 RepID=A0ABQ0LX67_MYCCL|nr:predicted protein [Mycena chlorophos]